MRSRPARCWRTSIRTCPIALIRRRWSGARRPGRWHAAALVSRRADLRVVAAHALLGAGAAVIATYLAHHARRLAGEKSGAPDALIALAEDVLTYAGGGYMLSRGKLRPGR